MRLTRLIDPGHSAVKLLAAAVKCDDTACPRLIVESICQQLRTWTMLSRLGPSPYDMVAAEKAGNCIDLSSLSCSVQRRLGVLESYVLMGSQRGVFPARMHAWTMTFSTRSRAWVLVDPQDMRAVCVEPDQVEKDLVITALFNDREIVMSTADRLKLWKNH